MEDEIVNIVDENCQVLFQTTRQEAHQKGLFHRIIIADLIDSRGKWHLVEQALDRQDPGCYVCAVGGHIIAEESEIEALKRETAEEIGLEEFRFKRIGQGIFARPVEGHIENHYYMVYEIYADENLLLGREAVGHRKFSEEELRTSLRERPGIFGAGFHFVIDSFYPSLA